MSSEFCYSILFLPGSLNRVSISMAYMAHHTLWRMRIRTQCIHIQSVHYDFWQWLRAAFSLLAVGITVNFIATMCCCYVTAVVVVLVQKNQTNPLLFGKKSCVWDEAHNNGLPSTVYNVTMHGNYYSITPSGDMMWFSVLSFLCFIFFRSNDFLERKYDHLKKNFTEFIQRQTVCRLIKHKCCHTKPQIASFLIHGRLSLFVKPY